MLDYNTNSKSPGQIASLYTPDRFRTSDHDPVLVGLDLGTAPIALNDSCVTDEDTPLTVAAPASSRTRRRCGSPSPTTAAL